MLKLLKKKKRPQSTYKTFNIGFHGDKYLIKLVDYLVGQGVSYFVETGSNVGTTFTYFAKRNPSIRCFTCEPDDEAFSILEKNASSLNNVHLYHTTSQEFMDKLQCEEDYKKIVNSKVLFWLDAHSYGYEWPLRQEISFIAKNFKNAYVLIDDFKNSKHDVFGYDEYDGQVCSHNYIQKSFGNIPYQLIYPDYTEKTSEHHPLRGWGLYVIGEHIKLSKELVKIAFEA